MADSIVNNKAYLFAPEIIKTYKIICAPKEFVLSTQLLIFGTSVGINIRKAIDGASTASYHLSTIINHL